MNLYDYRTNQTSWELIDMPAPLQDSARPYVTARAAAAVLGVPQSVVEADVRRVYPLDCLIGAESGGVVYVSAWELEGERLAAHRERLRAVGDSAVEHSGAK